MDFRKLEWLCVIFMLVVVMVAAGFWALTTSMVEIGSEFIWVGWVWWGMLAICIVVIIIFVISIESVWSKIRSR